ncbi:MAG: PAS-domain containing protein, partial [Variovorax sp.]
MDTLKQPDALGALQLMVEALDGLGVAACAFDENDSALLWNRSFFRFFPEHAADLHVGEPYAANLRRFYRGRLDAAEMPKIERYVQEGIARHRKQQRPFSFEHRGLRLQASVVRLPGIGSARMWKLDPAESPPVADSTPALVESTLLDNVADGVMVTDAGERIVWVNEPFVTMYGLEERSSAIGRAFADIYGAAWEGQPDVERCQFEDGMAVITENLRFAGAPFELPLPGDRWSRVVAQRSPDGRNFYVHVDITLFKRQQHQLRAAEARARESEAQLKAKSLVLEATLDRMEQGIMMVNPDRVVEVCNRRAMELLDLPRELMASRPTFGEVLAYQWERDEFQHTPQDVRTFVLAGGILDKPHCYDRRRPDGRVIEIQSVPIEGGGVVRTYADITERKAAEERIRYLARHDGLTSLSNREVFLEALHEATLLSQGTAEVFAVYFIDLDKFKQINDRFGHAAGDEVLVQAAARMRAVAADADVVARLGGDEFAILRRGIDGADAA